MPDTPTIILSAFSLLFSITGFLLKLGIDGVRTELKGLREDLQKDHDKVLTTEKRQDAHKEMCEERHRRLEYELASIKGK